MPSGVNPLTISFMANRPSILSKNGKSNESGGEEKGLSEIITVTNSDKSINKVPGALQKNIFHPQADVESALNEREISYKEYLQFGYNPEDAKALLEKLETEISDIPHEYKKHTDKFKSVLSDMKFLVSQLSTLEMREKIPKQQLDDLKKREQVVREIIGAFSRLPDFFRKIVNHQQPSSRTAKKEALTAELVENALQRLLACNRSKGDREELKEQIRQALSTEPQKMSIRLREWLEAFWASGLAKMAEPVRKDLQAGLSTLDAAAKVGRQLVERDGRIFSTGFGRAITRLSAGLEWFRAELKTQMPTPQDKVRIPGDNSVSSVTAKLKEVGDQSARELSELLARMNRETPKPFSVSKLVSFDTLEPDKKKQCLELRKMAVPVHDNAGRLKRVVVELEKAISEAGTKLPGSATPEDALLTELMVLTGDTPETRLIKAVDQARAVALKVLNEPGTGRTEDINTFPYLVQETSDELVPAARLLLNVTRQVEGDFRQKDIVSTLGTVKKTAQDIVSVLNNGLEHFTGVARHGDNKWLHGMQTRLHRHSYEIISLLKKGKRTYPLTGNEPAKNSGEESLNRDIHLAVLPLLNEAEKIQIARRQLALAVSVAGKKEESAFSALEQASRLCSNINLDDIHRYGREIKRLLHDKKLTVLQYNNNEPVKLGELLNGLADDLAGAGKALQSASLHALWEPTGQKHRSEMEKLRSWLDDIKASIKDAVELTTGHRLHNTSPEGMIARDAAEWLTSWKKASSGVSKDEVDGITEAIITHLSEQFRSQDDPEGKLFRRRIELVMRDAEKGMIPWPQTPEEYLSGIKTPKEYTLAWAEKRLTYGLLYNLLVHHTPAGMFSLYKKSLGSPLRLLKLLLAPIRMEVTKRSMEKVRPGNSYPAGMINEYYKREVYQTVFRLVSMLLPQLPKTLGAAAIASYGLHEGGNYRTAFLKRAISRLPGDLLWTGVFTAWDQVMAVQKGKDAAMDDEAVQQLLRNLQIEIEREDEYQLPATLSQDVKGGFVGNIESLSNGKRVKKSVDVGNKNAITVIESDPKIAPGKNMFDKLMEDNPYVKQSLNKKLKTTREWQETSNVPEKIYTQEDAVEKIVEAIHEYNYLDTGAKIINFIKINACIDEKGRNTDGSVNATYLREVDDFKATFKDNIMSYVDGEQSGDKFSQYMNRLMTQIVERKDNKETINGKVYIKVPRVLAMIYSTMLNHIRRYDKDTYSGSFKEQDIVKFIHIKTAQKNIRSYVLKELDEKIGAQFKRIDDSDYHSIVLDHAGSKYNFLNYIAQPYLDEKSAFYLKMKQEIDKDISGNTSRKFIEIIYDNVIDELNKTIALPVPFLDSRSAVGEYCNTLIKVLRNAQNFFGGLYSADSDGKVDSSLANKFRSEIKSLFNKFSNVQGYSKYEDEIEAFIAANKSSGANGNASGINIANLKAAGKFKERLSLHIDGCLVRLKDSDLIVNPSMITSRSSAFISELQRMIGDKLMTNTDANNKFYSVLKRFSHGKLSKSEFRLHKNDIIDFFMREVVSKSFADSKLRSEFSVMFLSEVTGIDFEKIDAVSEEQLSHSGKFAEAKSKSIELYNRQIMTELFAVQEIYLDDNLNKHTRLMKGIEKKKISLFGNPVGHTITQEICQKEYNLALDFVLAELKKDEDIKSFIQRIVGKRIELLESEVRELEQQIYKDINSSTFDSKLKKLEELNILLLDMRNELKERLETVNYIASIASRCSVVNGKYISPYISDEVSEYDSINFENAKIAALRHLYKIDGAEPDELQRQQYLNTYNALIVGDHPDACHVQNLAALYSSIYYHPVFKDEEKFLLGYVDSSRESGKIKKFNNIVDDNSASQKIKIFLSYSSNSLIRHTFNELQKYDEDKRRGDSLRGTYFSINDIKKRSEIANHSLSEFSAQFNEKYTSANMDKDTLIISGGIVRQSGIDPRQLDLPPKKVYTYKHLIRDHNLHITRDRTRELPRNDDVVIVVTPNNSVLVSVIYGNHRMVRYMPPAAKEPKLGEIIGVVKDLAPYSQGYYARNKKGPEFLPEHRQAVIADIDFYYHMDNKFNYSFSGDESKTQYLVLDSQKLQLSGDGDLYSWGNKDLLVLEKTVTGVSGSDTAEQVLHRQIKNSLQEKIEVMKGQYNDAEDSLGAVYNYAPLPFFSFASAARKLINGLPINDSDIGVMAMDLFFSSDSVFRGMSSIQKSTMIDCIRNEIKTLEVAGKDFVKIEGEMKVAVSNGLKKFTAAHPLSTFLTGDELVKPGASQLAVDFHALDFNTTTKTFFSSGQVSLESSLKRLEGKFDSEGISFSDQVYYNALREKVGANQLRQMGLEANKYKPRNMIALDDIEEIIAQLDFEAEAAVGQYNNAHIAYEGKVWDSEVTMLAGDEDRLQTMARFVVDSNVVLDGVGNEGLAQLERQGGRRFHNAQFMRNGAISANIIANKANNIFSRALMQGGENIYQNLMGDVRNMWPALSNEQVEQVLTTIMRRNQNVALLTTEMERSDYSNLCFFHQPADQQSAIMGTIYTSDASKTIFVNVDAGNLAPQKTILHETSHYAGTIDFIYQSTSSGVVSPIREILERWRENADIPQMMQNISHSEIRTLFNLGPQEPVEFSHYQAAFEIANSPHFAANVIKNNADTYVEFLELVDKKYLVDGNNQVIVNQWYRGRRDASSDAEAKKDAAKKLLLRMLYSFANS